MSRSGPSHVPGRVTHQVNNRLAFWLMTIVALAPVPLGSNRPPFWMITASAVALIGLLYGIRLRQLRSPLRVGVGAFRREALLLAAFLGYAGIQLLPLGGHFQLPAGKVLESATLSLAPGETLVMLISVAGYGLFFLLFAQVAINRARARVLLTVIFATVVAFAIYGLVSLNVLGDTLLGFDKSSFQGFATGTFGNRNSFATFLASALPMGVALLLDALRKVGDGRHPDVLRAVMLGAGMLFIGGALLATGSRMGSFAGALGAAVALMLGILGGGSAMRVALVLGALLVLAGIGLLVGYGGGLLERVLDVANSSEVRLELYRQVLDAIALRPWLGYGGGSFQYVFPLFEHPPLAGDLVWNKTHDTYLALWFEMGVIAGSTLILIVLSLTLRALTALRNPSSAVTSIAAVGAVAVFAVHSITDFSLEIQANAYLMLAVLALSTVGTPAKSTKD